MNQQYKTDDKQKNKAVFFDRDGVINSDIGHYYIYKLDDFQINSGIIEGMKLLQDNGFLIVIISNQGGIAKGEYTKSDTDKIHNYLMNILENEGVTITEIYYCPHHDSIGKCLCRKPDSILIEKAIAKFNIDTEKSFMIGDSPRDIQAAEKAGIKGFKIDSNSSVLPVCQQIINI